MRKSCRPAFLVCLALLAASLPALAQTRIATTTLPAPAQPETVALGATRIADLEIWHADEHGQYAVRNVTRPSLTVFRPVGKPSAASVIIAPGGAFLGLAIEKEGWEVARWFANRGVTAFVLKYRTLPTPIDQKVFAVELEKAITGQPSSLPALPDDTPPDALADGLAALRHVRTNAGAYGVDPRRVGFMGFSAGGFLSRSVVEKGGADRPDFVAPIYPAMGPMTVPANAPPMFVAIAADDFLLAREKGLPLLDSYRNAGRSIEFHLFSSGGHGFGAGVPGTPAEGWLDLMHRWMRTQGLFVPDSRDGQP